MILAELELLVFFISFVNSSNNVGEISFKFIKILVAALRVGTLICLDSSRGLSTWGLS